MDRDTTFGDIVREHRNYLDLTQAELARRVACATITIRKIEANSLRPSIQIAERLATSLKIPLEERAAFVRLARSSTLTTPTPQPLPTPPPTPEEIGLEDLSGRAIRGYELGDRMGEGGFGVVYRAIQPLVEREVAVKIILPRYADHPEFIRRFEAEAQLVARLEHPYIVPLYDYWREPGAAFLVMRLMRGGSLHSRLKDGFLSLDFILRLLNQVGGALYAAHRMGVIHRDLKPANILLDEDENSYLADFGVAKNLGNPEQTSDTLLAGIIGSPAYVSPEQIRSEPIRPQADIYALGLLLFELLTGRQPFPGPTPIDYAQQHLNQPTPPLLEFNPNLPPALEPVLSRATAKSPEERYPDIPGLVADFQSAVTSAGIEIPASVTLDWLPAEEIDIEAIENPYKGLRAFQEADSKHFFGRETLVQDLLGRMAEENDLSRFLAVVGPSGSGKSSAVKAGLIPSLRQGGLPGSEHWFIVEFTPSSHPFEELETALLRIAVNPPESLLGQLHQDERGLLRAVSRILPQDNTVELLLVIDQFEELFTLVEDEDTRAALLESILTSLLDPRSRLRVLITLRADFTDRPLEYVDFGELLKQRTEFVLPLTPDELELAIIQPARDAGLALEAGLCQRIISDLGDQPGTLPLLQYTLTELFERRVGRRLTLAAYQDSGGVLGALGKRAEETYSALDSADKETTRQVFLRLVTLGEGVEDTRRRVLLSELEALSPSAVNGDHGLSRVLESFGRARLLSFDRDPLTRSPTVEVAHEALLREWSRLREWLDQSRADIRSQRVLGNAAADWLVSEMDPSFLLRGARLDQFAAWAETTDLALTQVEQDYLEESQAERRARESAEAERLAHEAALERRSRNFLRGLVGVLAIAAIVAVVLSLYAFNQQGIAQDNAATAQEEAVARATQQTVAEEEAEARGIAEEQAIEERDRAVVAEQDALGQREEALRQAAIGLASQAELQAKGRSPETSVLLALEAVENYPYTWQAEKALGNSILNNRLRMVMPYDIDYQGAEWSSDSSKILIGGLPLEGNAYSRVLDASTGEELLRLTEGAPNMASWSPDEKSILALNDGDVIVNIWDVDSGTVRLSLDMDDIGGGLNTSFIIWEPWSPSGDRFMLYTVEGLVKIFDTITGEVLQTLSGHEGVLSGDQLRRVDHAVWSPNGDLVAVSSEVDNNLIVYRVDSGEALYIIPGGFEHDEVRFGSWSPSGDRFVTRGFGGAKLYEAETGRLILDLPVPQTYCAQALWSPDGSRILTREGDESATVWDAGTGQVLSRKTDYAGWVDWSPSGDLIAVAGVDGVVYMLDPATGHVVHKLAGTIGWTDWLLFSPNGERILIVGNFISINILDLTEASLSITVPICFYGTNPAWSPDGQQIAFASHCAPDNPIKFWDAKSGEQIFELTENQSGSNGISWSPSGDRFLSVFSDGTAKVWDAGNWELQLTFLDHEIVLGVWSPDGKQIATGDAKGNVIVWDSSSGAENFTFSGFSKDPYVGSVRWSPDGTRIISTSDRGEAIIWDSATGEVQLELFPMDFNYANPDAAWTSDGKRIILFSSDGFVRIFDANTGNELDRFPTRSGGMLTLFSLSPTEERMIMGSYDIPATIWDIGTGWEMLNYDAEGFAWPVYSPDGTQVLIEYFEGEWGRLQVFPVWDSLEELVAYAKDCCVVRELTPDEREIFGLPPR